MFINWEINYIILVYLIALKSMQYKKYHKFVIKMISLLINWLHYRLFRFYLMSFYEFDPDIDKLIIIDCLDHI